MGSISIEDNNIHVSLPRHNKQLAWILAATSTFILGFTDFMIGSELSFSIFYLIPVTLAVLFSGKKLGLIFSGICALVWISADFASYLSYSNPFIPIWNTLVRLAYFSFHTLLLTQLLDTIYKVKQLSLRDPLTQAANWRCFEEFANRQLKMAMRDNKAITLAYLDADNFKQINDRLGHSVGDEVLITLVKHIQQELRPQDMLARLGGDEFAILLYDAEFDNANDILMRLQQAVNEAMQARQWEVTLSIGAMVFTVLPSTINSMISTVDKLMYAVKKSGKNNYIIKQQESTLATTP